MVRGYFNNRLNIEESGDLNINQDMKEKLKRSYIRKKRKRSKKILRDANEGEHFFVKDGGSFKNVEEFRAVVLKMSEEQFFFHTNRGQNDFANWLRGALNETGLATRVEMIKTRNGLARLLGRFLKARNNNKNKY